MPQHQTVPLLQKGGDALLDGGVAEECGDELAGAVRLVAAGEAAGDEHHLGGFQFACAKRSDAAGNAVGAQVVDAP